METCEASCKYHPGSGKYKKCANTSMGECHHYIDT
jgi:hypothetical protein